MPFRKANELYISDEERGATTIFMFNRHPQNNTAWGWPDNSYLEPNRWHRPSVPQVPVGAKFVNLMGMYVGGVAQYHQGFMIHIDFRNPNLPETPATDWTAVANQGDVYEYFAVHNMREAVGGMWVPCLNSKIMFRWKLDGDPGSPYGLNFWCQAYAT
jgi:hypothetical protein